MNKQELEERRDKVVKLYTQEDKSINQIANELNIDWATVKRDLINREIKIQKIRNQHKKANGVSNELFKKIDNSDSAYWLGFLYADGSIRKDRNEINLDLQARDIQSIKDFHDFCNNQNAIREHKINRNGKTYISYTSGFSNHDVKENLISLGCMPKKSLILSFPTESQVPTEFLYDFVRGYIDGDGCIQYNFDKFRYQIIILGTKDFLSGLMMRLKLFEHTTISKDNTSNIYKMTICGKHYAFSLLEKLYEGSKYHLLRKFEIYEKAKRAYNK